jgi:hypothetical protein
MSFLFNRKPSRELIDPEPPTSSPFEKTLCLSHKLSPLPPSIKVERMFYNLEKNIMIVIEVNNLSIYDIFQAKKRYSIPIPSLFLSSQAVTILSKSNFFLVTTSSDKCSLFSLDKRLRLIKASPVALPFAEYIPQEKIVISYGKDMLVIWNLYGNKIYHE